MALIRNVMVGRDGLHRAALLDAVERAGGADARSYITTGNVTFDAGESSVEDVTVRLEQAVSQIVERPTMVAVRSLDWVRDLVAEDVFAGYDPGAWELEVSFLRPGAPPLDRGAVPASYRTHVVTAWDWGLATARPPDGAQRPHVNRLLERATGLPATARGWGTLVRLAEGG